MGSSFTRAAEVPPGSGASEPSPAVPQEKRPNPRKPTAFYLHLPKCHAEKPIPKTYKRQVTQRLSQPSGEDLRYKPHAEPARAGLPCVR